MFCIVPINAIETDYYPISDINLMLQNINDKYETQFHIYEEDEYYGNQLDKSF